MFKQIILIAVVLYTIPAIAQEINPSFRDVRKIEVSGAAEMSIVPDEIYYVISLKEYKTDNKKTTIDVLEKQLTAAVAEAGLPKETLKIEDMQGYRPSPDKKRKNEDFLAAKQYVLKLNNLYKVNEIIMSIDSKGVEYTDVSKFSHSKIEQYRREIKIKALQAAKEKASYLVSSINEQLAEVLQIQEVNDEYPVPFREMRASNMMMKGEDQNYAPLDFKEIKIRYEVRAIFKIK